MVLSNLRVTDFAGVGGGIMDIIDRCDARPTVVPPQVVLQLPVRWEGIGRMRHGCNMNLLNPTRLSGSNRWP